MSKLKLRAVTQIAEDRRGKKSQEIINGYKPNTAEE